MRVRKALLLGFIVAFAMYGAVRAQEDELDVEEELYDEEVDYDEEYDAQAPPAQQEGGLDRETFEYIVQNSSPECQMAIQAAVEEQAPLPDECKMQIQQLLMARQGGQPAGQPTAQQPAAVAADKGSAWDELLVIFLALGAMGGGVFAYITWYNKTVRPNLPKISNSQRKKEKREASGQARRRRG